MRKIKAFLQKPFIKKTIAPVVRAIVKQVPFVGAPIVELATTLTQPADQPKKHTSLSQIIQWCVVGVVVLDVVFNKGQNLKDIFNFVLNFLG